MNADEVSEKTGLQYLFTWIIIFAVLFNIPGSSGPYANEWLELGSLILNLIIFILTVAQIFQINSRTGNEDFLKKFISVSFVTGFRFLLVYSFLWLAYKIFMYNISDDIFLFISNLWKTDIADLIHSLLLTTIFSILLIRSFKRMNIEKRVKTKLA